MAPSSRSGPASDRIQDFVAWIDRSLEVDLPVLEIAGVLTDYALPDREGLVSPFIYGSEGWYWPWNRVGFGYIDKKKYSEAATIFSGAYLAGLRIQHDYQERIHKGMPLCNIAYSFLMASEAAKAQVPAILGMFEDVITSADPTSTGNLSNLRASGYPEAMIQVLINYARDTYRSKGRSPLYPEVMLHAIRYGTPIDTMAFVSGMQSIASRFASDTFERSLVTLRDLWRLYSPILTPTTSQGDPVHGRAEPTLRVGPDPIGGTASVSGSNASR